MDLYKPGEVYTNLIKMLAHRGVVVDVVLGADSVVQKLNHHEHIMITGKRPATDIRGAATVVTILIAPNSKYANKTADFKRLLKDLPKTEGVLDVILVSEDPLTTHIKKQILAHKEENAHMIIEDHDYRPFMINPTEHKAVPKHVIPTHEEITRLCRYFYTSPEKFPKILQSDVQAVWLGLKPGMVVKIYRVSETGGVSVAYRYCIAK